MTPFRDPAIGLGAGASIDTRGCAAIRAVINSAARTPVAVPRLPVLTPARGAVSRVLQGGSGPAQLQLVLRPRGSNALR